MDFFATYYGANSWLLEFGTLRIIVDPWLKGDLVFPPGPWLFKGELTHTLDIPIGIDMILLTQGQPDHTHIPTLLEFNRSIPICSSEAAASIVKAIGFTNINVLLPGSSYIIKELTITATSGAPVPKIENGYILNHECQRLYIEPHGYLDKVINSQKLDTIITPTINLEIPIFGSFIKGKSTTLELINKFNPDWLLSSTTGGETKFSGLINNFIKTKGSFEDTTKDLPSFIKCIDPLPGKKYKLTPKI